MTPPKVFFPGIYKKDMTARKNHCNLEVGMLAHTFINS